MFGVTEGQSYRSPNERDIGNGIDDSVRGRLLLLGLAARAGHPAQDNRVDGICPDGEHYHCEVSGAHVQGGHSENEAEHSDGLGDGDVPSALVALAGADRPEDGNEAGDEVRRAGEHQSYGLGKPERLHNCREEVLEAIGRQVHMLHEGKEPELRVRRGFLQACKGAGISLGAYGVPLDAIVSELALSFGEPASVERMVGQGKGRDDGDEKGHGTQEDEEPSMTRRVSTETLFRWSVDAHLQPLSPATSSIWKMPAAMRPANAVARMLPV